MIPYVRRLVDRYVRRVGVEVTREDVQTQLDDTVASVERTNQCITVNTALIQEPRHVRLRQTELH